MTHPPSAALKRVGDGDGPVDQVVEPRSRLLGPAELVRARQVGVKAREVVPRRAARRAYALLRSSAESPDRPEAPAYCAPVRAPDGGLS